jgi:periplasmic protein TonB
MTMSATTSRARRAPRLLPAAGLLALSLALLAACGRGEPERLADPPTNVVAVDTPPPEYPVSLACADIGGKVVLALTIGTDGRPKRAVIEQRSGVPELDRLALEAVQAWRFRPATYDGAPVETTIQVPMTFRPPPEGDARCAPAG